MSSIFVPVSVELWKSKSEKSKTYWDRVLYYNKCDYNQGGERKKSSESLQPNDETFHIFIAEVCGPV